MKRGMRALLALLALMMTAISARAQTLEELRASATPLREGIEAYGRTIQLDVSPALPDIPAMGVYRATLESGEIEDGVVVHAPLPEKRRGLALRRKEPAIYTPDTLTDGARATGHPLTAVEALGRAWAHLAPRVEAAPGVEAAWRQITASEPVYWYDKNAGTWGAPAVEGGAGSYSIEYDLTLHGAPLLEGDAFVRDSAAYYEAGGYADWVEQPCALASADAERDETSIHVHYALPVVRETLAEAVDLAPMEAVYDALRGLARDGQLRGARELRLGYRAFLFGERPEEDEAAEKEIVLVPVWVCRGEFYESPEEEMDAEFAAMGGPPERDIVIDARTGALLEGARIVDLGL